MWFSKDDANGGGSAGRNSQANWKGKSRSNDTHASTTDPDARLFMKSHNMAALMSYRGHVLMENRSGLVVGAVVTHADGMGERASPRLFPTAERLGGRAKPRKVGLMSTLKLALPLPESDLPLAGIRVAELCSTAAGPFCAMLLADMGADVIKIEPPNGDGLRQWPPLTCGYSENFAAINRNKRSVVLDLKDPESARIARQIVQDCDVLVENSRPGVMMRLGLGYDQLRAQHSKLVYCSISAFGQTGPRATEGGFDLTIQAAAGVMSVTGEEEGSPVKCGVPVSDFASGLYGAFAIAAAIAAVRAGGDGCHIDVPMFGCTLAIAALQTSEYFGKGRSPGRLGSAHPRNAPYQAYEASDGFFVIAAGNHQLWLKVLQVVGMPLLASDPRFNTTAARAANQRQLTVLLEEKFHSRPVAHWLAVFRAAGVPHAAINDYASALSDPQVEAMGWVQPLELPNGSKTRSFGSPLRLNGRASPIRRRPPSLGEHTESIRAQYTAQAKA